MQFENAYQSGDGHDTGDGCETERKDNDTTTQTKTVYKNPLKTIQFDF